MTLCSYNKTPRRWQNKAVPTQAPGPHGRPTLIHDVQSHTKEATSSGNAATEESTQPASQGKLPGGGDLEVSLPGEGTEPGVGAPVPPGLF